MTGPADPGHRNAFVRNLLDLPRTLQILRERVRTNGVRAAFIYLMDNTVRVARGAALRRYSEVEPYLFLGGQHSSAGLGKLQTWGVSSVVNLRDEFDDAEAGVAPEDYLYLPIVDDHAPDFNSLCDGVRFITERVSNQQGVYVHCMLGVGRSVTLVAAYLVCTGATPTAAWAQIRGVRPFILPTAVQRAQLERFALERPCCAPVSL